MSGRARCAPHARRENMGEFVLSTWRGPCWKEGMTSRFTLRSFVLLAAITGISATSAAGGPGADRLAKPPTVKAPEPTPAAPAATPAAPKGWPSTILSATVLRGGACNRAPGPNEVIVYSLVGFGGDCAVLTPGFYPYGPNLGIGDDAISSIKVGSAVRARVFKNPVYGSDLNAYAPNTNSAGLGGFDNKISSMRVELASRSQTCNDVKPGEIALYRNPYETGDCVVLDADGNPHDHRTGAKQAPSYPSAEAMGIANDSISSIKNNSAYTLTGFVDENYTGKLGITVPPYTTNHALPGSGFLHKGIEDNISSVQLR